ncbi:protein of unknown function, DUF563 family [Trichomonas vaginalis G3]|uniref:protein of unknown function, DUF563 family n=1 Tax=Trichomonas vaginalis (strain ATCC PRA-98 / G3) TaxID=412133 RepID=UPI0021E553F9|nr:protein of unknown function, DUF563 family [Trichomonas vaginalis G3]KAI5496241.1 protein of unknown function, DUF563 family [Trichomonas vaginalis G3]
MQELRIRRFSESEGHGVQPYSSAHKKHNRVLNIFILVAVVWFVSLFTFLFDPTQWYSNYSYPETTTVEESWVRKFITKEDFARFKGTWFQYPFNNKVKKSTRHKIYINKTESPEFTKIEATFPPYFLETPHRLNIRTAQWFWKQKVNQDFFDTSVNPIRGTIHLYTNSVLNLRNYSTKSNSTHYYLDNTVNIGKSTENEYDTAIYIGKEKDFWLSGVPKIALMLLSIGKRASDVVLVVDNPKNPQAMRILKMFNFKKIISSTEPIHSKEIVIPVEIPRVHPYFYDVFSMEIGLNPKIEKDKVVLIKDFPIKEDENLIADMLQQLFSSEIVIFDPFHDDFKIMESASVVIGNHGSSIFGCVYAGPRARVIEVMNVDEDGRHFDDLEFHRVAYDYAVMVRQTFYQFYQTGLTFNSRVNVKKLEKFIRNVLKEKWSY